MWLFRRRPDDGARLPATCFISHAYADAEVRERLLHTLPPSVKPVIFPPITVAPEQLISNALINTLMDCKGLIYLEGGASARSFWVAFERDYALRMKKPVYAFDPATGALRRDTASPLDLKVYLSYSRQDAERVGAIHRFMRDERHFDAWIDVQNIAAGRDFRQEIETAIESRLRAGGYVVVFLSQSSIESQWVRMEYSTALSGPYRQQVLPARLDAAPMPFELRYIQALQLFGDAERSARQRMDDLIVCLYWLIYRNTHQNVLE